MKGPKHGIIKASFSGGTMEERQSFSSANGMLLISVGQPYHESDKFKATIELVGRKFKSCTLMLADTLQRHNISAQEGISEQEAYQTSLERGDAWLYRNKNAVESLDIPYSIVRWDNYLKYDCFCEKLKIVKNLHKDSVEFKNSVSFTISEYTSRNSRHNLSATKLQELQKHCFEYLIEECAVMLLWLEDKVEFEIYPTRRNAAMQEIYNQLILPKAPNLLKSVNLRFKRYADKEKTSALAC